MTSSPLARRAPRGARGPRRGLSCSPRCHEVHFDPNKSSSEKIDIYDDLFAVSAPTPQNVVAAGYWGSVYVSDDGGASLEEGRYAARASSSTTCRWPTPRAAGRSDSREPSSARRTAASPGRARTNTKAKEDTHLFAVHALDANTAWAVGEWGARLFTDDGGASWQDRSLTIDLLHPQFVWLSPPEQERVRKGEKVYEDVGLTDVFCLPASTRCWIIGEFGYIFHTDNAGQQLGARRDRAGHLGAADHDSATTRSTSRDEHAQSLREFAKKIIDSAAPERRDRAGGERRRDRRVRQGGRSRPPLFEILEARVQSVSAVLEEAGLLSDRIRKRGAPPWDYEDFLKDDPEFLRRYLDGRKADAPGIAVAIAQNPYLFTVRFEDDNGYIAGLGGVVLRVQRRRPALGVPRHRPQAGDLLALPGRRTRDRRRREGLRARVDRPRRDLGRPASAASRPSSPSCATSGSRPDGKSGFIVGERGSVLSSQDAGANWKSVLPPPEHKSAAGG